MVLVLILSSRRVLTNLYNMLYFGGLYSYMGLLHTYKDEVELTQMNCQASLLFSVVAPRSVVLQLQITD